VDAILPSVFSLSYMAVAALYHVAMTHVTPSTHLPASARSGAREKPLLDSVNCVTLRLRFAMARVPTMRAGVAAGGITAGVDFARAKSK